MSLDGAYDPDNIFARILRNGAPAVRVEETSDTLTIMDVFPQARGHMLVIPKAPSRHLLDAEAAVLTPLFAQTQRVARAAREALRPDGVIVTQFSGAAAGQTVFHLHIHVIPRWADQPLGRHGGDMADPAELQAIADQVKAALR